VCSGACGATEEICKFGCGATEDVCGALCDVADGFCYAGCDIVYGACVASIGVRCWPWDWGKCKSRCDRNLNSCTAGCNANCDFCMLDCSNNCELPCDNCLADCESACDIACENCKLPCEEDCQFPCRQIGESCVPLIPVLASDARKASHVFRPSVLSPRVLPVLHVLIPKQLIFTPMTVVAPYILAICTTLRLTATRPCPMAARWLVL